jgi:hypothetical protein
MFFCAISGEPPQEPVVSAKSGKVYERRLIVKYINENGTDPVTGDKLEESDLIEIKASAYEVALYRVVKAYKQCFTSKALIQHPHVHQTTPRFQHSCIPS